MLLLLLQLLAKQVLVDAISEELLWLNSKAMCGKSQDPISNREKETLFNSPAKQITQNDKLTNGQVQFTDIQTANFFCHV